MPELTWGDRLEFTNDNEYYETLGFLCKEENYVKVLLEGNDQAGAWAPGGRLVLNGIESNILPRALKEAFSGADGRINDIHYVINLRDQHVFTNVYDPTGNGYMHYLSKASLDQVRATVPEQFMPDFDRGYNWNVDLMAHIASADSSNINLDEETEHEQSGGQAEGRTRVYYTKRYERNPQNREAAIRIHGTKCMICGFDFEEKYGDLGKGFIEVHHIKPLSELEEEVVINPETDLVCVCSNCHRMLHRFRDYIVSTNDLKDIMKSNMAE